MSTVKLMSDDEVEAHPKVEAVFNDIRATRGSDFVNNFWRALAYDPDGLERTWLHLKSIMATPGTLDPKTREMIYIAVSSANGCSYCVHSHTAAAKEKGMSAEEHGELMQIIGLAGMTNHLVTALQVPVDPEFDVNKLNS